MNTDKHGTVFRWQDIEELKVHRTFGWNVHLQFKKVPGDVYIATYSVKENSGDIFKDKPGPGKIHIVCDSGFTVEAQQLKNKYPHLRVAVFDGQHAKLALIPSLKKVVIGSQNLTRRRGEPGDEPTYWDVMVAFKSVPICKAVSGMFEEIWNGAVELKGV